MRIKHRYLLVNILYPQGSKAVTTPKDKQNSVPDTVDLHQPTSDELTSQLIISMVRRGVVELFGDYGAGMIANGLKGRRDSNLLSIAFLWMTKGLFIHL